MTPRQRELLRFIERRIRDSDGVAPTVEEMRRHLGLAGKGGVHRMVDDLVAQGHLMRRPKCARGLALPPAIDWTRVPNHEVRDEYARRFGGLAA